MNLYYADRIEIRRRSGGLSCRAARKVAHKLDTLKYLGKIDRVDARRKFGTRWGLFSCRIVNRGSDFLRGKCRNRVGWGIEWYSSKMIRTESRNGPAWSDAWAGQRSRSFLQGVRGAGDSFERETRKTGRQRKPCVKNRIVATASGSYRWTCRVRPKVLVVGARAAITGIKWKRWGFNKALGVGMVTNGASVGTPDSGFGPLPTRVSYRGRVRCRWGLVFRVQRFTYVLDGTRKVHKFNDPRPCNR